MKKQLLISLAVGAGMAMASMSASAYEAGDWRTTIGMTNIQPDNPVLDDAGSVDDATQLSFTGGYFFTDNLALELLASLPFSHDVTADGIAPGAGIAVEHLPPTLSLQWYFNNESPITPYIGIGANYTIFVDETAYGAIAGASVDVDNSFGYALQAGLDYAFTENLFMNVDLRYINIEADATVNGSDIGEVEINPTTVGVSLGYRF